VQFSAQRRHLACERGVAAVAGPCQLGLLGAVCRRLRELPQKNLAHERRFCPETLARFRCVVTSTIKPPLPTAAMLGETIVHAEDIRRPLGIRRDYPITTLTRLANYYQGSDLVVLAKGRIVGLRLQASDGPFATGSGPSVSGSTLALIMAMTGRVTYCDELDGDGVATLRARCTTP